MSNDAHYILAYDILPYEKPTPMDKDIQYLESEYGGIFEVVSEGTVYWDKPKYLLPSHEYNNLHADQILERQCCELWKIVK